MTQTPRPTTHPDYGELDAFRTGEADAEVAAHVAGCAECQNLVEEIRELAQLLKDETALPPIPAHVDEKMQALIRREAARVRREVRWAKMQRWALAAMVVLSLGALVLWRQLGHTPAGPDAVDALLAARAMGPDGTANRRFDFNGDGMVDERDVDATLRQVVSLVVAPAQALPLPTQANSEVRFRRVDIFVDAGSDALAAYQVEITTSGDARIGGIGGGDHPAFAEPAYYDAAALHGSGRIILAAISTDLDLPRGRTRVADIRVREAGEVSYKIRLMAAARADGSRFTPAVSVVPGGQP